MTTLCERARSPVALLAIRATLAATCMVAGVALGSDGISVKVTNDTSNNVVVTVIDMNDNPEQVLVSNQTIYGFASLSIRVSPDASGYGHIRWTATSGSAGSRACGHKERDQLSAESIVHVSAGDSCDAT
jgi:hypothetical protein